MTFKSVLLIFSLFSLSITLSITYAAPTFNTHNEPRIVTLDLQNMSCTMCQFTIKKSLQNVTGVQSVNIDFDSKTATVLIDPNTTNSQALIEASTNAGYPAAVRQQK